MCVSQKSFVQFEMLLGLHKPHSEMESKILEIKIIYSVVRQDMWWAHISIYLVV